VLRPGSVTGTAHALRLFAAFLVESTPQVTRTAQVTRRHIEDYKPWLAKRLGQNKSRVTTATLAHGLGTLRMFFVRIDEWGWEEAPPRVPIRFRDQEGRRRQRCLLTAHRSPIGTALCRSERTDRCRTLPRGVASPQRQAGARVIPAPLCCQLPVSARGLSGSAVRL
jgi:hypothetical protein